MYQSFAMEAQTDATRCCIIVFLLVQVSLRNVGVKWETWGHYPSQYQHCPRFSKNVCWSDTRPSICHHQSFLKDYCTTKQLEIDKKWVFSIFFVSLTLKWPWCNLDMTLVLSTSKAQLLLMLLFAHKLRSCWCLQINLTLQNILIIFNPPPQEFSGGDASVPKSSALKGLIVSNNSFCLKKWCLIRGNFKCLVSN